MADEVHAPRFTGRTLEEALRRAAKHLKISTWDELRYEVIAQKAGFLFLPPSITIEAWVDAGPAPDDAAVESECSRVVIEDMSIRIEPPRSDDEPETVRIWAVPPVRLFLDGVTLEPYQAFEVTPNDVILADIGVDQIPSSEVLVHISEDQLTASIELERKSAPRFELRCESVPMGYRITAQQVGVNEPAPVTIDEVVQVLRAQGVTYRINEEAIRQVISGEVTGRVVVSEGKPPTPTVPDTIEYRFDTNTRRFDTDEVVDFFEFWVTPCVESGDVIAVRTAGHEGQPGVKVTGEAIPVAPYRPVKLEAGDGAQVSPDGFQVIATRSGRPVLNRNKVAVNRLYELNRGVGLHTSNIHFDGDVVVRGDVNENMLVEATGSIDVNGGGFECLLVAKQHVQVARSFVGSHAIAGGAGGSLGRVYHGIRTILPQLEALVESAQYLDTPGQEDSSRQDAVVRNLLQSRYRTLPSMVDTLLKQVESVSRPLEKKSDYSLELIEFSVPDDVYSIVKLLAASLSRPELLQWDPLKTLIESTKQAMERLEVCLQGDCMARIGYCQSSIIEADGDILILRQGSINSTLRAGRNINIAGVMRGGEAVCLSRFVAKEVGAVAGTSTSISVVDPQGTVKASIVHPNVQLTIGGLSYKFTDSYRLVEAKLTSKGSIMVTSAGREL